ncbi:hypothetical protein C8F01DRAFT_503862 [Mycena amicta]|nr:hypothetical protein C8F01DRAFT_503862 [Mycena amicta]
MMDALYAEETVSWEGDPSPPTSKPLMAPTFPPELERCILVDYVSNDAGLRSCALVCGRFCYWAQSRLFHTIRIDYDWDSKYEVRIDGPWLKRVDRFLGILDASPHLVSHIRTLLVNESFPTLLTVLSARSWDTVETLRLRSLPLGDDTAFECLKRLVSLPALRSLELGFRHKWSASYLTSLLAHCSSTLTDLHLMLCHDIHAYVDFHLPCTSRTPSRPLPQIGKLTLTYASAAVAALADPSCPLDLTRVRHLEYRESPSHLLGPLMRHIGNHMTFLKVPDATDPSVADMDLTLPSLAKIECNFTGLAQWYLFARLPDQNVITELTFTTSHDKWQDTDEHIRLLWFEKSMLPKLPFLRAVVFEVTKWPRKLKGPKLNRAAVVLAIERVMPRLTEMGMLSVIFVPYDWDPQQDVRHRQFEDDEDE